MDGCKLKQVVGQTLNADATLTPVAVNFDSYEFLTDPAFRDGAHPERITPPVVGLYEVSFGLVLPWPGTGQGQASQIVATYERYIGGVSSTLTFYRYGPWAASTGPLMLDFTSDEMTTTTSDYFALRYAQNRGSSFTTTPGACWFSAIRVG